MDPTSEPVITAPLQAPGLGLAIACLVLGILACIFSPLVIGAPFGLIGLVLGAVHIGRYGKPGAMAWWGVGLCLLGVLASIAMGVVYIRLFKQFQKTAVSAGGIPYEKWEGVAAPDISMTALDGTTIRLSELSGKRVVLDFWATWCGPCVREIPHFMKLRKETSSDDLVIVGISQEDKAALSSFARQKGLNYLIASAGDLPTPYKDVQAIPTTFFIDRKGVIQTIVVGYHEFDHLKKLALATDFKGEPKGTAPPAAGGSEKPNRSRGSQFPKWNHHDFLGAKAQRAVAQDSQLHLGPAAVFSQEIFRSAGPFCDPLERLVG